MRIYLNQQIMHNHKKHIWETYILQIAVYLVLNHVPFYNFVAVSSLHLFSRVSITDTTRNGNITSLDVSLTTPVSYYRLIYTSTKGNKFSFCRCDERFY
jgi:hypothetical protein